MPVSLRQETAPFAQPNTARALAHLALSLAIWVGAVWLGTIGYGNPILMVLSVVMFVGASIRLFAIQHDNGHLSYFRSRRANTISGVLLSPFTANAFFSMRYNHNRHHAYIGNLDEMKSHEVMTWTVAQWQAAGPLRRLGYRLYRSPLSIWLVGPLFIFFIRYRLPRNAHKVGLWDCAVQNVLMAVLWGGVYLIGGREAFVAQGVGSVATTIVGTIMVYSGHNHEETYWRRADEVDFSEASLKGASVLSLGPVFDFMSFNFAYHDLHHLNARIPCYNLRACHRALADHLQPTRLGLVAALATIRWKLWDEERGRMVRFADVRRTTGAPAGALGWPTDFDAETGH